MWARLNDAETLKASIPGCESLEKLSDTEFQAVVKVKIGPVSARFNGKVHLTDIDPPNSYRIAGEGDGGVAGFAKGGANVRLADADGGGTKLSYDVDAQVGGKIAQLGVAADRRHRQASSPTSSSPTSPRRWSGLSQPVIPASMSARRARSRREPGPRNKLLQVPDASRPGV